MTVLESPPDFKIEILSKSHKRDNFSCGVKSLDEYLKSVARQDLRNKVSTPFVAVDANNTVIGYYTLSSYGIKVTDLPSELIKKLPRYPLIGCILIGRLAVDGRYKGIGLGETLLMDAFYQCHASPIASFAVIVEAKNEEACKFYKKYGFRECSDSSTKLFLPMKTIDSLF